MSPFAKLLIELRNSREIRQGKFAEMIGYEQSYLSALEGGTKGPPSDEFLIKASQALSLNSEEQERLELASLMSQRKFVVPVNAPEQYYIFCYELNQSYKQMQPNQMKIMLSILRLLNESTTFNKAVSIES